MKRHPHPLISDGKHKNSFREHVRRVTRPIFEQVLQETKLTRVLGGGSGTNYSLYNPHNSRYYFEFDKNHLKRGGSGLKEINNGKELLLKNFEGCRIVIKKSLVEITNKKDKDRVFKISGSANQRKAQVTQALELLGGESIDALKKFVKQYGGKTDYVPVKVWIPDNKVMNDDLINQIPGEMTFRNDVVKKVYNTDPKNVEFSDPIFTANYFRNAGLRDFSPEIAESLEVLGLEIVNTRSLVYGLLDEHTEKQLCIEIGDAFAWRCASALKNKLLALSFLNKPKAELIRSSIIAVYKQNGVNYDEIQN